MDALMDLRELGLLQHHKRSWVLGGLLILRRQRMFQ